jgi:hypothetical protein
MTYGFFLISTYFFSLAPQQRKYTDPCEGLNTFLKELFDAVKVGQLANEKMDWIRRGPGRQVRSIALLPAIIMLSLTLVRPVSCACRVSCVVCTVG